MPEAKSPDVTAREEAQDMLMELREFGGVLVAEADFGGDEIRYNENHDGTPYQVRSAIGGEPRWYSREVLLDLIEENAEELYWKDSQSDSVCEPEDDDG